jgi:hypothetical protein
VNRFLLHHSECRLSCSRSNCPDPPLSPLVTLSPMATLGVGSFGEVEWVSQDDVATDLIGPLDDHDAHGWFTLGIGGNVDLFGQD